MRKQKPLIMLVAEDDPNDLALLRHAVSDNGLAAHIEITRDGEELIHYLRGEGDFANRLRHPFPDLIVLDLKMPRVNGLEALRWLRKNPESAKIPTIMLS